MDAKKSPKADLESKKVLFIQIGLIISLSISLAAFEWKSYDKRQFEMVQEIIDDAPEEIVPITEQKVKPPPPPPPKQVTVIDIVDDDVEIEDEIEIDADIDMDTEMEEFVPMDLEEEQIDEAEIFQVVESMPSFPGGEVELQRYLNKNIDYPIMARESGIQGRVYVTFVVETNGSITDVRVMRGIGGGCDEEAVRVVKMMPKWTAGMQRGRPVRVQFNLPVRFVLQ